MKNKDCNFPIKNWRWVKNINFFYMKTTEFSTGRMSIFCLFIIEITNDISGRKEWKRSTQYSKDTLASGINSASKEKHSRRAPSTFPFHEIPSRLRRQDRRRETRVLSFLVLSIVSKTRAGRRAASRCRWSLEARGSTTRQIDPRGSPYKCTLRTTLCPAKRALKDPPIFRLSRR